MFQLVFASCLLASLAAAPADEMRMVHVEAKSYAAVVDVIEPRNVPNSGMLEVRLGKTDAKIVYDEEKGNEKQNVKIQNEKMPVIPNVFTTKFAVSDNHHGRKDGEIWFDGDDGNMKIFLEGTNDEGSYNYTFISLKNVNNKSVIIRVEENICKIYYVDPAHYHMENQLQLPKNSKFIGEESLHGEKVEHWQGEGSMSTLNAYINVQKGSVRPVKYIYDNQRDKIVVDFKFSASKPPASVFKYDTSKCIKGKNVNLDLTQEFKPTLGWFTKCIGAHS